MPHGCPRPRMRWNGAIGAIARCKKVSTVCAPKSRSRHALRLICGEKPGARGVATLFTPYMRPGQDESNPVSLLQCLFIRHRHPLPETHVTRLQRDFTHLKRRQMAGVNPKIRLDPDAEVPTQLAQ